MRPIDVERVSVGESVDRYVEMVRAKTVTGALAPGTAEVYARDAVTFAALAGADRVLDDLSGEDVDAVLLRFARKPDGRRSGAVGVAPGGAVQSAASQARFRRSVSALFQYAVVAGWVQLNPMDAVTVRPRHRGGLRAERRALTVEQAEGLLGAARGLADPGAGVGVGRRSDQRTELRDGLIVLLLAAVGPRVSELTRANVEDFFVNGGTRYWRVFGKGGRTRDVPLPGPVVEVLDVYLAEGRGLLDRGREPKALLLSWRGRRLARGDVQGVIDRVLARVEPGRRRSVTPHGLRHTTATHLLAAATDMDAVRRVLGHADLATLGRYRDELPGELEAAMRVHPLLGPVSGRGGMSDPAEFGGLGEAVVPDAVGGEGEGGGGERDDEGASEVVAGAPAPGGEGGGDDDAHEGGAAFE
ncbi:tyrosine-type recombinase/integrase [Actinomadura algeriensis]|uniref:Site-specific recombinase XerD n=1 Tax=Actinomadura algeriensis TaxID=1679523 RepID=A0ABR9K0I6_9ACTN|nr:tyrosine-type recombinase/integrase [Actinomadura algeriensis]MBE1536335.1 site-specific recombinase XerD [Actinomadura algeriensis]